MSSFSSIEARAIARHGADALAARLVTPASDDALRDLSDDRYLSTMTMRVFSAGFRWSVIQSKWEGFEEAFQHFDPEEVAQYEAAEIAALAQDTRIVRNRPKILATVDNAAFVARTSAEHGGFGHFIASWPSTDIVGLWHHLKTHGNRLGGDTGAWFLRLVGKDTFRLSKDVQAALIEAGVLTKPATSKGAQRRVQEAMNAWAEETGRPLCQLSTILACSTGEVYP
jgi:3-methyladenine DNA glycosylase Tag